MIIIQMPLGFGKEEYIIVNSGWTVPVRFKGVIGYGPDDIRPEIPAIVLEFESNPPGNSHHIIGFEPFRGCPLVG